MEKNIKNLTHALYFIGLSIIVLAIGIMMLSTNGKYASFGKGTVINTRTGAVYSANYERKAKPYNQELIFKSIDKTSGDSK